MFSFVNKLDSFLGDFHDFDKSLLESEMGIRYSHIPLISTVIGVARVGLGVTRTAIDSVLRVASLGFAILGSGLFPLLLSSRYRECIGGLYKLSVRDPSSFLRGVSDIFRGVFEVVPMAGNILLVIHDNHEGCVRNSDA